MADFYIKQGDTSPAIKAALQDSAGAAVNLTGAAVRFLMRPVGSTLTLLTAVATVDDAAGGKVSYSWQTGDTNQVGRFHGEFEVTFSSGKIETFPNDSDIIIEIRRQL